VGADAVVFPGGDFFDGSGDGREVPTPEVFQTPSDAQSGADKLDDVAWMKDAPDGGGLVDAESVALAGDGKSEESGTAADGETEGLGDAEVEPSVASTLASGYRGTIISRPGHDYGPSIMKDGDVWRMWWCGQPSVPGAWDSIWYATSPDGLKWSCPKEALLVSSAGLDKSAVCDPAVVKVGGKYFLYYTGINTDVDWSNRVFLATTDNPDGAWTKYPDNGNPQPVLQDSACDGKNPNDYCVGQSAVLVKDGTFYHWYTDTGKGAGSPPSPGVTMLATSTDGVSFQPANDGLPVFDHADTSVAFDIVSGKFLMVYGNVDDKFLYWTISQDGSAWDLHDNARKLDVNLSFNENHNPGLATDPEGKIASSTFCVFGAGTGWGIWDMDRTDIVFHVPGADLPMCAACAAGNDCAAACGKPGFCGMPGSADPTNCCTCLEPCKPSVTDCSLCVPNGDCNAECKKAGKKGGTCATPGSSDPTNCCSCQDWEKCEACLAGFADCNDACHHSGKPSGWCAAPSSTDPTVCCTCVPDTGCENCLLGGAPSCMAACQAAGNKGGWCAVPGSSNPAACCTCF